jgi:hypothetical protein
VFQLWKIRAHGSRLSYQGQRQARRSCVKLIPPAALVQNEGEKPGGKRRAELSAGSETGARRDGQSIEMDLEVSNDAVRGEAGTELGSSDCKNLLLNRGHINKQDRTSRSRTEQD